MKHLLKLKNKSFLFLDKRPIHYYFKAWPVGSTVC
jgi:hypothetical protein